MKSILKVSLSFFVLGAALLLSGCLKNSDQGYKINLEIWGPIDDSRTFEKIIEDYQKINPYVGTISYRKFNYDDYKKDLIDALASGQGPDIFLIDNNWLPYFKNKIEPAPEYLLKETDVRDNFADVVEKELVSERKIFALPLSVDSLALYCNKDMFNARGITSFPTTWEELAETSRKLTRIDDTGNIRQSGAALGTAFNINRSADILALMMIQKGTAMVNSEKTSATFNKTILNGGSMVKAGEDAFKFYTQFADLSSPYYAWNSRNHYSIDAFSEESVAMMVNYSWQAESLILKNSKLNFTIVPVPQFAGKKPVNLAFYMGFAVNKNKMAPKTRAGSPQVFPADYNKLRIHESWQLIKYLAMKNGGKISLISGVNGNTKEFPMKIDPAEEYLKATGRPAARRDLIEKQKSFPFLSAFAGGNLIAESWYQSDPESISSIFEKMIDEVNKGSITHYNALQTAASRVSQIMEN